MEYSERIKKIDALFDQMVALGVQTLSVSPTFKGYAYLVHDNNGDLREAEPKFSPEGRYIIRRAKSPNGICLTLAQRMATERVYRKKWGLDDGDK